MDSRATILQAHTPFFHPSVRPSEQHTRLYFVTPKFVSKQAAYGIYVHVTN